MFEQTLLAFNKADPADIVFAQKLLADNNLPYQDIEDKNVKIFILKNDNTPIGIIGLEVYHKIALLRSMVIEKMYKNQGYGKYLFNKIVDYCKDKKVSELYLLTCSADRYFEKLGFEQILRNNLPEEIKQTKQFSQLCPCSAICMMLNL